MKCQKLTPVLMVNNVNDSIAFYTDVLGFELTLAVLEEGRDMITARNDTRPKVFAMLNKDEVEIMFETPGSFMESFADCKPGVSGGTVAADTMMLYLDVDDVSQWAKSLEGKANIIKPLHDTHYGRREVSIRDCNNTIITFSQSL